MISFLEIISFIFIVSIFFLSRDNKKYNRQNRLKEFVKWCIIEDSQKDSHYKTNLPDLVSEIQNELNISSEYRLSTTDDWDIVKKILKEFQNVIIQSYFSDTLPIPKIKSSYKIENDTCFFYLLQRYLSDHRHDKLFLGCNMLVTTDNSNKAAPLDLSKSNYELTDFSLIFNKLYYITYMYCKKNSILNPRGKYWNDETEIERVIKYKAVPAAEVSSQ